MSLREIPQVKTRVEKRPIAITIVGLIAVIAAFGYFMRGFLILENLGILKNGMPDSIVIGIIPTEAGLQLIIGIYYFVVSISAYLIAIGLIGAHRWSWVAFMIWSGFNMIVGLTRYFYGAPESNYLYLFLSVVVAYILNLSEVQKLFGIQKPEEESHENYE